MSHQVDTASPTALAVKAWANEALMSCRKTLEKVDTTWDQVVGLRREIKRLNDLVQLVTENAE